MNYATIGLYYFKSFALFKKRYTSYEFDGYKEEYIALPYNVIIKEPPLNLYTHIINENFVHVFGTPEDIVGFYNAPFSGRIGVTSKNT